MRRAKRGLSTWALFLTVGVAPVQACGGRSAYNASESDAASSAAGAEPVGAAGAAGNASSEPAACSWPAAFDAPDPASGQCVAGRAQLSCRGLDGSRELCLSDNFSTCPDSGASKSVANAACKSVCQADEYALSCGGVGPDAPGSSPPPTCRAALVSPGGPIFYCCPCGAGAGGACAPLGPVTSAAQLAASDIVAAGRDSDGTLYVLTEHDGVMRLFVSAGPALLEKFQAGTGQGSDGALQFWTFQYADPETMTIEVQKDASGTRMFVAAGAISGKGFDVGSTGSALTLVGSTEAAAMPARTTQTFHVSYAGAAADGTNVVVVSPDHASAFEGYRVFLGPPAALQEQVITSIARGLSIPVNTTIQLTVQGASAELSYVGATASLTSALESESFTGPAVPTAPAGANFLCR